jgi:hypothetical protein
LGVFRTYHLLNMVCSFELFNNTAHCICPHDQTKGAVTHFTPVHPPLAAWSALHQAERLHAYIKQHNVCSMVYNRYV